MQSCKVLGPDGFSVEFFKATHNILAGPMVGVFNDALKSGHLPLSVCQASVSLIPKKVKDPMDCGNYRPSLCSVDAKILAKIFAKQLEPILFFNIRRVNDTELK